MLVLYNMLVILSQVSWFRSLGLAVVCVCVLYRVNAGNRTGRQDTSISNSKEHKKTPKNVHPTPRRELLVRAELKRA